MLNNSPEQCPHQDIEQMAEEDGGNSVIILVNQGLGDQRYFKMIDVGANVMIEVTLIVKGKG